jgi:beta-mannanase
MKTVGYLFVFLAGALLLLAGCTPHIPVPGNGIYHGALCDFGPTQDQVSSSAIADFEALAGKKLAVVGFGNFWGENYFPREQLQAIKDHGALPLIYWDPWGPPYELEAEQDAYALDSIIHGKYDAYVKAWADSMKAWGKSVMVAFAPEMNGAFYPWEGDFNGSDELAGYGDPLKVDGPERYVDAWKKVVNSFRTEGVKNVSWVFAPNALNGADDVWNAIKNYYPGDDYVDWLGIVAFGARTDSDDWIPFDSLVGPAYAQLDSLNSQKPMMLAEWGVAELPDMGSKPVWLDSAFAQIKPRFPRLKAAVYWDDQFRYDGDIFDLRIGSSDSARTAYSNGVKDDYWLARP